MQFDVWFPDDFTNFWEPGGWSGNPSPFKFMGIAGGPSNGTSNFWSDGQGTGTEEGFYWPSDSIHKEIYKKTYGEEMETGPGTIKGWSWRMQGTNRYDNDTGTLKQMRQDDRLRLERCSSLWPVGSAIRQADLQEGAMEQGPMVLPRQYQG
jgi:hypothetical protein